MLKFVHLTYHFQFDNADAATAVIRPDKFVESIIEFCLGVLNRLQI